MKLNDRVEVAKAFAGNLHEDKGQMYGKEPYSKHLQDVVNILLRFEVIDRDMLAAGYLHDIVEDTGVSIETIKDLFGDAVTKLVEAVTDVDAPNRKARKALTYPKIKATPGATQIKLADRIANVENSIATNNLRMHIMYKKEYSEFMENLRVRGELDPMWDHLSGLIYSPQFGKSAFINSGHFEWIKK